MHNFKKSSARAGLTIALYARSDKIVIYATREFEVKNVCALMRTGVLHQIPVLHTKFFVTCERKRNFKKSPVGF